MPADDGNDPAVSVAWEVARRIGEADGSARALGIELEDVGPGYARISMTVTEMMVNAAGIAHGGFTFLLADSAFALACNSHGALAVARSCQIEFLAPAYLGEVLVAEARERYRAGRKGIYDVSVTRTGDEPIAEFRGHSSSYSPRE
jgi:phenylacetic acid degradation protein PaaD